MIEFRNVDKMYPDGTKAVQNFSVSVQEGELLTLIGPSGCGKTTTMKMINRLIEPTSGRILIHDEDISDFNIHELRWNIGYVLQEIALFPHMTIEENVAVVPEMRKWKKNKITERTDELMQMVGLNPETYKKRLPRELSGGEQQRVGVVRALASDPDIILMDEPFSALDPISREQLQSDIRKLQKEIQKTIVFVTHDMDEAMAIGDRVCLMKDGEIVQLDTPQNLILHPINDFVKNFIGEKKSPWQTAVDVIMDDSMNQTIRVNQLDKVNLAKRGTFIVVDEKKAYHGILKDEVQVEAPVLPNDLQLIKAVDIYKNNDFDMLPVVRDNQVIGTLSYSGIVHYLQSKTKLENGVVQH